MSNPEKFYYKATEEEGEKAYEISQRSGRSIDEVYERMGIERVSADEPVELTESDEAALLLDALKDDLKASKLAGLTTAIESSHPNIEGRFNVSRIDENTTRERMYRSRAEEKFRKVGNKVLGLVYSTNNSTDEHMASLPDQFYSDFTGKENAKKRAGLRRKLTKFIKQAN